MSLSDFSFTTKRALHRPCVNGLSKDDLIGKLMLGKMQRAEYSNGLNEETRRRGLAEFGG